MGPLQSSQKNSRSKNKIFSDIISLLEEDVLLYYTQLTSITKKGLTLQAYKECFSVSRKDILKQKNHPVELFLSQYELPLQGVIKKINSTGKGTFKIYISFTESTPIYYRECIEDLLN